METALSQIIEQVRGAVASGQALRIQGGGSKDFVGPSYSGAPLDVRVLQGIVAYEPSELVVTVRAGTPLAQLQAALHAQGQCLPFEPPHFGDAATVGGMVAAGLSGPARASVGAVRDFVLGVECINGHGHLLRFGGQVMKNVAGYDVSRLMAGSWGTLGVLTEVSLKVLPLPPAQATLRFDGVTQSQALKLLNTWGGQPLPLNASSWQGTASGGTLHVRLCGAQAAVQAACRTLGGEPVPDTHAAAHWLGCQEHTLPWLAARSATECLWRLSVPQVAPPIPLPAEAPQPLLEWHGALRWVKAPRSAGPALHAAARAAGGSALLFRAEPGPQAFLQGAQDAALFQPPSPALQRLHNQLKHAFDPAGIFNPGRTMA